jgi:hypothetical protein
MQVILLLVQDSTLWFILDKKMVNILRRDTIMFIEKDDYRI